MVASLSVDPAWRVGPGTGLRAYIPGLTPASRPTATVKGVQQQPRPPWIRRLTRRQLITIDVLVAVPLAQVLGAGAETSRSLAALPMPVGYGLAVVLAGTVALRRWRPWPAFLVALVGSSLSIVAGFAKEPMLAPALVLYILAATCPLRASRAALLLVEAWIAATAALSFVVPSDSYREPAVESRIIGAAVVQLAAWMIGMAAAKYRAYTDLVRDHAERRIQEQIALAHARLAQAQQAVAEERLRIAQELHDIVAHSMSVIAVQAGVGHHVAASQPAQATQALAAIEATSRDTLQEMRRLLGMLRDGSPAPADAHDLQPAPGLSDLPALVRATEQAGLRVDLRVEGTRRDLPAGLELAAYRIVQEALTNIVKHAGTDHGRVVVTYTPDELGTEGVPPRSDREGSGVNHGD
jgi:signal transduction histidine kinase